MVSLLQPSVVHLLSNSGHLEDFIQSFPLDSFKAQFVFIPVNDQTLNKVGGSHWSFLMFVRQLNIFCYFDSFHDFNKRHAKKTARILGPLLTGQSSFSLDIHTCSVPQQGNGKLCPILIECRIRLWNSYAGNNRQNVRNHTK